MEIKLPTIFNRWKSKDGKNQRREEQRREEKKNEDRTSKRVRRKGRKVVKYCFLLDVVGLQKVEK